MSFTFFFDPDDLRRLRENQRVITEVDLQQQLICYRCRAEKADTWIRNLTIKNIDGSYAEFLLGSVCRAELKIERPTEYKRENNVEVAPVVDRVEKVEVE